MDNEFSSKEELFKRVTPALNSKLKELKCLGYSNIDIYDIWNYLIETKWVMSSNLDLDDIVNDILNCCNVDIYEYVNNK